MSSNIINGEDIICFSRSDWDTEMVSNRFHIMSRFSRNNRVLFFELPVNIFIFVARLARNRLRVDNEQKITLKKMLKIIKKRSNTFYTITPVSFELPFNNILFIRLLNKTIFNHEPILLFYYKLIKYIFHIENPIFWFYDFQLKRLLKNTNKLSCYHCTEDYRNIELLFSNNQSMKLGEIEDDFARRVDLIFAVSNNLCKIHTLNNQNTFFISNGVDLTQYNSSVKKENPEKKIIGYIGNISLKVDLDLILKISTFFKECEIYLIGPIVTIDREKLRLLRAKDNIVFFGKRDVKELPHILSSFSVCIIPFITREWFVKSSQPLKLYEYLSSGKPIVSTYMDCLKELPAGYVYISFSHDEFIYNINLALNENDHSLIKKRVEFSKNYDWDILFYKMNSIMLNFIR